jgi:hypothetical protein
LRLARDRNGPFTVKKPRINEAAVDQTTRNSDLRCVSWTADNSAEEIRRPAGPTKSTRK